MKRLFLLSLICLALFSGCTNAYKLRTRNLTKGVPVVSTESNTKTLVVTDASPIISIIRPEYQLDIYSFSDGGEIHYVSVVTSGGVVTMSAINNIMKIKDDSSFGVTVNGSIDTTKK